MARPTQRRVYRQASGNQNLASRYNSRRWYEIPDWAKVWVVDNAGWVTAIIALVLFPPTLLALVLGVYRLPFLDFLGVPTSANGLGLAAAVLIIKFIFVVAAIRPLFKREIKGWYFLVAAATVHLAHSVILQHAITGTAVLLGTVYLYVMVRRRYH
ncbi:hypothetical protein EPO04_00780 [Patescibacteria group bacterium]|nr:MAG: hypothetical protein EPO04_00780 [Patescibacteria group bacterium]